MPYLRCHFEWPWVTLSDFAKCSMTRSIMQSLCDSWASCFFKQKSHKLVCASNFSVYGVSYQWTGLWGTVKLGRGCCVTTHLTAMSLSVSTTWSSSGSDSALEKPRRPALSVITPTYCCACAYHIIIIRVKPNAQRKTELNSTQLNWSAPRFWAMFVDRSTVGQHCTSGPIYGSLIGF